MFWYHIPITVMVMFTELVQDHIVGCVHDACFQNCIVAWVGVAQLIIVGRAQRARTSELNGNFVCIYVCIFIRH